MIRSPLFLLLFSAALMAADQAKPVASPLDGLADAAKATEEEKQAALDGGSTIGFIPVSSTTAAKTLGLYLTGFFRDEDSKGPVIIPKKAQQVVSLLPELKAAGATHLIAMSHEGAGDVEYVRFLAVGKFTTASVAKLTAAGLGKLTPDGSFDLVAFKDGGELGPSVTLPALPVARLAQMAQQLAAETDCAVDIIPLASKDALTSYDEAIREAFVEEGQPLAKADIPAHALKIPTSFSTLKSMGATHVIVTAFQNIKGADIVLVVAKGQFTEEAQAKAKTTLSARLTSESTLVLARWVDGEEKGTTEAQSTSTVKTERPAERMDRRKGPGKK
jgi:hypothetical protein